MSNLPVGLIVDDENDLAELYRSLFAGAGIHCVTASGGYEAFELIKKHGESLKFVLSDISMPEGDGIWLLNRVITSEEPIKSIRMYLMSAFCEWTREDLIEQGAFGFYRKPFNISQTIREISSQTKAG